MMDQWIEAVKKELGIDATIDRELILNIARDAAHAIERPAAPITTYLIGYAVARGADAHVAAAAIEKLAKQWSSSQ